MLTLLHFRGAEGPLSPGDPAFAYFSFAPVRLRTVASHRPGDVVAEGSPRYLAFLRWRGDGRFQPVTHQFDSALSFHVLTSQTAGSDLSYYRDQVIEHAERGQQDSPANGSQPSRSETNRTSSAAGSRR
jgi:hypothetical protein